jgi:hypothetical protein
MDKAGVVGKACVVQGRRAWYKAGGLVVWCKAGVYGARQVCMVQGR